MASSIFFEKCRFSDTNSFFHLFSSFVLPFVFYITGYYSNGFVTVSPAFQIAYKSYGIAIMTAAFAVCIYAIGCKLHFVKKTQTGYITGENQKGFEE